MWSVYTDEAGRGALLSVGGDGIVLALDGQSHVATPRCNASLTPWEWDEVPLQIPRPLIFLRADEDRPLLPDEFTIGRRFRILVGPDTVLRPDVTTKACGCPGFGTRLQRDVSGIVASDVLVMVA